MQKLDAAAPEQIARWVVLQVRWPQFVRWIQREQARAAERKQGEKERDLKILTDVIDGAKKSQTHKLWLSKITRKGLDSEQWLREIDLWQYLKANSDVSKAGAFGMW